MDSNISTEDLGADRSSDDKFRRSQGIEGDKDGFVARRARFEDWQGILDIRRVYKGHDYMAASFYATMYDSRYVPNVVLHHDKIVAFAGYFFINDVTTYGYGGRTAEGYEGRGLHQMSRDLLVAGYPALTHRTWAGIGSNRQDIYLRQSNTAVTMHKWDVFLSETPTDVYRDRVLNYKNKIEHSTAQLLSYQEAIALTDDVPRFLQTLDYSYVFDLLPITPHEITGENIRATMMRSNCIVSRGPDGELTALSFFKSIASGSAGAIHHSAILVYGTSSSDCIEHALIFLRHLAGLCGPHTEMVSPFVHVPYHLRHEVRETLTCVLGQPIELDAYGRTDVTFVKDAYQTTG